ncbi:adhesion G-protein coupled receptor D1-like [Anneissia japonica]|uniref:adhesion G-protein coupled receptor D1-like n=1 Tax=Anneissia japonica TaxID=1529436 RepID=UPI001425AF3B|nr:adhesion G-protein coupled receptor D1-like [Anneissia japonica]
MMIEGAYLYVKASQVHRKPLKIIHYAIIGWGSPIIIVGITLCARYSGYGSGVACWLGLNDGVIWAFVAPVLIVGMINTLIMVSVIRTFTSLKANADKARTERMKSNLRAILLLQPLLGVTWLFGVLSFNFSWAISFQYLFVICNSLQGAFIFILHCVMNEEVKKAAQRYVHRLRSSHHSGIRGKGKVHSKSQESRTATTAVTDSTDAWN